MPRDDGRRVPGRHRPSVRKTRSHQFRIPRPGRLSERHHRRLSAQLPVVPRRRGAGSVPRSEIRHPGIHQQRRRPVRLWRSTGRRPARGKRQARSPGLPETLQKPGGLHLRHGLRHRCGGQQSTQPRRQLVYRDLLPQTQEDARHHRRGRRGSTRHQAGLRRGLGRRKTRVRAEGPSWARSPATPWQRP